MDRVTGTLTSIGTLVEVNLDRVVFFGVMGLALWGMAGFVMPSADFRPFLGLATR